MLATVITVAIGLQLLLITGNVSTHNTKNERFISFTCDPFPSLGEPQTVHELTPADIDIIAGMGDSLTAGVGLAGDTTTLGVLEHRGRSWSIGGEESIETVVTLTNILRQYNSDITGYSLGIGGAESETAFLNVAISGSRAGDLLAQADELISRLQSNPEEYDFDNDWKILTLMIGYNDICQYCFDREDNSPSNYSSRVQIALDRLHDVVPKMLINLVPYMRVDYLEDYSTGFFCNIYQGVACQCSIDEDTRPELRPIQLEFYVGLKQLIDSGRYDTRDDFTVVLHPFLVDQTPPLTNNGGPDPRWFAVDCFHWSRDTHTAAAVQLWNSMFTPESQKLLEFSWEPGMGGLTFQCPTQDNPYIYTRLNSFI